MCASASKLFRFTGFLPAMAVVFPTALFSYFAVAGLRLPRSISLSLPRSKDAWSRADDARCSRSSRSRALSFSRTETSLTLRTASPSSQSVNVADTRRPAGSRQHWRGRRMGRQNGATLRCWFGCG